MTLIERVDEKGKIFTPRIRKSSIEVNITTVQGRLHGHLHVAPGQRVKDQLDNREELFLAVTDATFQIGGNESYAEFVAINKAHVVTVVPVDEPQVST